MDFRHKNKASVYPANKMPYFKSADTIMCPNVVSFMNSVTINNAATVANVQRIPILIFHNVSDFPIIPLYTQLPILIPFLELHDLHAATRFLVSFTFSIPNFLPVFWLFYCTASD